MTDGYLRSCAGCSAHLLSNDPTSERVWCPKCARAHIQPFEEWAAGLKPGDAVYVQPYVAWRGLSRSRYLIKEREGDEVALQLIGIPESQIKTTIHQLAQHDVTPRWRS